MLETLSLISVIIIIIMLRRIVGILPAVFVCALRWKECCKLDAVVKTSRDRDFTALALTLPFLLTVQKHNLLPYRFIDTITPEAGFAAICAVFAGYLVFRAFATVLFLPHKSHKKSRTADNSDRTFFIIMSVLVLCAVCLMSLLRTEAAEARLTIIWLSAATYMLYLVRKFQIFQSSHSIFTSFLYLCALEIVPTGILVVSAIIF